MPRKIAIQPHLSLEELETGYRQATSAIARTHYQVIWLLSRGKSTKEVAEVTGYGLNWIYEIVRSYNRMGVDSLGDLRHQNQGAKPLLNDLQLAQLWQALQSDAPDGGLWNGAKVAIWMSELLGQDVSPQRGWEYLKGLSLRRKTPRPQHEQSSDSEQQEWKKKLATETQRVQQEYPDADVQVWAMDEHRLGLKPIVRKVWTPKDEQPIAPVNWRYKWLWLYGFVHPMSGETYWWILPIVRIDLFNLVLADFAEHFGIGKDKKVILVCDRAGWHVSPQVVVPEGIHLMFLPPHSPEMQPAERLWPLTNETVANKCFETLAQLEEALFQRCRALLNHHELIRGLTHFHWWPQFS